MKGLTEIGMRAMTIEDLNVFAFAVNERQSTDMDEQIKLLLMYKKRPS